jgi:heme/copper-type cytochrome/quinol oxidase subunit 3
MDHAATAALHPGAAPAHGHAVEMETSTGIHSDKMGMWVFLCSEVMFFTGLIGSYIVLRFGSESWPDPSQTLNIWLTAFNTFVLICSSVTMVKALEAIKNGDARKMKLFLSLTVLFGAFFLSVQVYEYRELLHHGFTPSASLFGSVFYTCTGFHGFHVFCGVVCMAFVTGKAFLGKYTQASHQGIETIGLYWHFVDLVWIILFTIVYLI